MVGAPANRLTNDMDDLDVLLNRLTPDPERADLLIELGALCQRTNPELTHWAVREVLANPMGRRAIFMRMEVGMLTPPSISAALASAKPPDVIDLGVTGLPPISRVFYAPIDPDYDN